MRSAAQVPPLRRLLPLVFLERAGESARAHWGASTSARMPSSSSAALVIGVGGGYGAVGFRRLIDFGQLDRGGQVLAGALKTHLGPAFVIVPLILGGAFVAWFVARFAPEAKGSRRPGSDGGGRLAGRGHATAGYSSSRAWRRRFRSVSAAVAAAKDRSCKSDPPSVPSSASGWVRRQH